jgi:hypothetical protein
MIGEGQLPVKDEWRTRLLRECQGLPMVDRALAEINFKRPL